MVSLLSFALLYFAPGDTAMLVLRQKGNTFIIPEEKAQAFAENNGLNTGFTNQYLSWFGGVLQGDLGTSYLDGQNINKRIATALGKTLIMTFVSLMTYLLFGVMIGVIAALHHNGIADRIAKYWAVLSTAIPVFWIALFVVWLLSVKLGILKTVGSRGNSSLILPGVLMGLVYAGNLIVIVKEKTLLILEEPFVINARAVGMKKRVISQNHVLKNILPPVVATATLAISGFIGSGVLMENIFSLSGYGTLLMDAVHIKDYMVVASATLLLGALVCVSNMVADVIYAVIDRRGVPNES
jgi:peptide/nickel transport system permease protein